MGILAIRWSKMRCHYRTSVGPHWYLEEHVFNDTNFTSLDSIYLNKTKAIENNEASGCYTSLKQAADIVIMVEIAIAAIGILLNAGSFFLLLHSSQRHLGTTPHLLSLAVSDCIYLWFGVITNTVSRVSDYHIPGPLGFCNTRFYTAISSIMVSNYGMTLLASLRALVFHQPSQSTTWFARRWNIAIIFSLWLCCYMVGIPALLAYDSTWKGVVNPGWEWVEEYYMQWLQMMSNVLQNVIIGISTCIIIWQMKYRKLSDRDHTLSNMTKTLFRKMTWLTVKLSVFQFVTTIPGVLVSTYIITVSGRERVPVEILMLMNCLYLFSTMNHAGNALFFVVWSESFSTSMSLLSDSVKTSLSSFCCFTKPRGLQR